MKVGFLGLVFIVLLVLKLTEAAAISWFIVFLPLLISLGILILFFGIALLAAIAKEL